MKRNATRFMRADQVEALMPVSEARQARTPNDFTI
jgi:hypothetical protein